ncbi:ChbG/HpnK family deacetylase [Chitinolyticbacter albus]|uniref:ChbG/HpnK family deacetylase n=1 Tax=Chitinolyticbacter albus TaxID=2961951 RepID=UPI00210A2D34|nr:ChbG/HpnK family deacetylase [Chitinolyticbacter albus]
MNTLQRLGYAEHDRILILHADDIGMCEATVSAWRGLLDEGLLTSASAMAPCPWFPAAAELARERGPAADLGLHLTLNCEWNVYRWGPVTGPGHGLTDDSGYFHPRAIHTHAALDLMAARRELAAQVDRALQLGIVLSHLDSHMLTLFHPGLATIYLDLCREHRLPPLLPRTAAEVSRLAVVSDEWGEAVAQQALAAEGAGDAMLLDSWEVMPFNAHTEPEARLAWVCDWLDTRGPGVHCLVGHPANDTPELRAIAHKDWPTRVADRQLLGSDALRQAIGARGFKLSGLHALREALG